MVFLWWCFCGGVGVVMFLWWCFCGGVFVLMCDVFVVVFLWWCSCRCVCVAVLLWWCFCGCVFVVVFLWWCFCGGVFVVVFLWYYRALLPPLKRRQNDVLPVLLRTTPVLQKLPKRAFRARLPQLFTEKASKMIVSCEASSKFHRTSFQNERFARCFRQFSQKKLPKGSFRARLPPNFTEQASKTSVSCEASSKFHRTSFQNDRFVRGFFQISQNKLPKRAFRAMLPTIFTKNLRFATVSRNRHTASCERVHPPKAKCASHYNAVHSQISKCTFRYSGVHKNV